MHPFGSFFKVIIRALCDQEITSQKREDWDQVEFVTRNFWFQVPFC